MKRRVAALLAIPALLLAAHTLAQSEEDFDPPPPPPEEYDPPPTTSDPDEGPRTRERGRGKHRSRNRDRDVAVGLGGLLLGEILEEIEDQPRSRPRECSYERAGGWMQPTQGVWQDDEIFKFVTYGGGPMANPQLELIHPWGVYRAWLPMVDERPTALVGAKYYRDARGNRSETGGDRTAIVIRGFGDCSRNAPVKVRFTLEDADGARVIHETPQLDDFLPLDGPPKKDREAFRATLPAELGLPEGATFKIQGENGSPYRVTGEIIRADTNAPTGLKVEVEGTVNATRDLVVKFVPLVLGPQEQDRRNISNFSQWVRDLGDESERRIPDVLPMRRGGLKTYTGELVNVSRFDPARFPPGDLRYRPPGIDPTKLTPRQQQFSAAIADYLGTSAMMSYADRVVAVVRFVEATGDEYEWLNSGLTLGFAVNQKVAFVRAAIPGRSTAFEDHVQRVEVVAHELTHTLPHLGWDEHDTPIACGQDIHKAPAGHFGFGLQLMERSQPFRRVRNGSAHMMGGGGGANFWISQCSFAHLIHALTLDPDPELFLVRAIVSREKGTARAQLMPGYDLLGVSDVAEGPPGEWSLRLKDGSGRALAQWPFSPGWRIDGGERDIAPVILRIPALPAARMLEVIHAGRVVASRPIPVAPPSLAVAPPQVDAARRNVRLRWTAKAADGRPVLSSVYYSTNGGRFFDERMFEEKAGEIVVQLDPAQTDQVIKIVVTDGARSREQIVRIPAHQATGQ